MGKQKQIVIDPMRLRDLPGVLIVERLSFPTPWSRQAFLSELFENDRAYYIVAKQGERIVGYGGIWFIAGEGHITNIAVHPECRKQGIGRRLLHTLEEMIRLRGGDRLTLEVRVSNVWAQHLYETFGFRKAGMRKGYYRDNNEDAVVMWKQLV